jgi:RNA polymerase sigma factor (sigma-70 family)
MAFREPQASASLDPAARTDRLEGFLQEHRGLIRRVVRHVGGWRAERLRDDIEQDVLVALWRRLAGEQDLDLTPSYVYKATLRETIRALRRDRGRETPSPEAREPASSEGPFEALVRQQHAEAIEACLSALSADRERAARLHLQGFRVEEVMRLCGWPYHKARNLIARSMADLRAALRDRGIDA